MSDPVVKGLAATILLWPLFILAVFAFGMLAVGIGRAIWWACDKVHDFLMEKLHIPFGWSISLTVSIVLSIIYGTLFWILATRCQ